MTLQQIFIDNLKKFRKKRGVSQMALAGMCDTSGNYISEIEMGRRIPSFEKIDKIAAALQISSYQLFIQQAAGEQEKKERTTKDFLNDIPYKIREEIISRLLSSIKKGVNESLDPRSY
jgi:transcriptional regulator with XRE-family HTH domain